MNVTRGESIAKTVLILANSRKLEPGRCIAGIEIIDGHVGPWVRPVSARPHGEVSKYERHYENGDEPELLDIVRIGLLRPVPVNYQSENWLLDPSVYWEKVGQESNGALGQFLDGRHLWLDGTTSTRAGLHDEVPLSVAVDHTDSIRLIYVEDLRYRVFAPGADFGNPKRRVQAYFTHGGIEYRLWVTDPGVEDALLASPDGFHAVGAAYLTISLGEPHNGYAYKLVAAVMPLGS